MVPFVMNIEQGNQYYKITISQKHEFFLIRHVDEIIGALKLQGNEGRLIAYGDLKATFPETVKSTDSKGPELQTTIINQIIGEIQNRI